MLAAVMSLRAQFESRHEDVRSRLAGVAATAVIVAGQRRGSERCDRVCCPEANNPALSRCRVVSPGAVIGVPACTARRS
jgi:hypothetical protein